MHDQSLGSDLYEQVFVTEVFERPFEAVAEYCLSNEPQSVLQRKPLCLFKVVGKQGCQALFRDHLNRVVGHCGWVFSSQLLSQVGCELTHFCCGKKLQEQFGLRFVGKLAWLCKASKACGGRPRVISSVAC